jgi:hypothetical protein
MRCQKKEEDWVQGPVVGVVGTLRLKKKVGQGYQRAVVDGAAAGGGAVVVDGEVVAFPGTVNVVVGRCSHREMRMVVR